MLDEFVVTTMVSQIRFTTVMADLSYLVKDRAAIAEDFGCVANVGFAE